MTFPVIAPFPQDGDPNFNSAARACMDSLRTASIEAAADFATLDAAVTTVTTGLSAALWVSDTTYALGALVRSPATGYLYRRLIAGAGTTDPSSDATNWRLMTSMGFPIVIVNAASHSVQPRTCALVTFSGQCTLVMPSVPDVQFECEIRIANGRWDNLMDGSGNALEGHADTLYLDSGDANGRWRYFSVALGYAKV